MPAFTLLRILWEDDRYGRVSLVMDPITCVKAYRIEIPDGCTIAGEIRWRALDELDGAESAAVRALLPMVTELAGDVYFLTLPLRTGIEVEELPICETVR